jgi:hypothetical protein
MANSAEFIEAMNTPHVVEPSKKLAAIWERIKTKW